MHKENNSYKARVVQEFWNAYTDIGAEKDILLLWHCLTWRPLQWFREDSKPIMFYDRLMLKTLQPSSMYKMGLWSELSNIFFYFGGPLRFIKNKKNAEWIYWYKKYWQKNW